MSVYRQTPEWLAARLARDRRGLGELVTHVDAIGSQGCKASVEYLIPVSGGTAGTPPTRQPKTGQQIYPLVGLCRAAGLPEPVPEYVFHPTRKWRFDYAFLGHQVAIEIEGGIYTNGRHVRGQGFAEDMSKYNSATMLGWRVLRYQPENLMEAIADLRVLFGKVAA